MLRIVGGTEGEVEVGVLGDFRCREIKFLRYGTQESQTVTYLELDKIVFLTALECFIFLNRVFIAAGPMQEAVSPPERTN